MTMECIETAVDILGRTYHIKCPSSEVHSLQQAAALLEEKMRTLRSGSTFFSMDGAAIIAALNLANELIMLRSQKDNSLHTIHQRLTDMHTQIELALAREDQPVVAAVTE